MITRSHGPDDSVNENENPATFIVIDERDPRVYYRSNVHLSGMDLYNLQLVAFVGCNTAAGGATNPNNLPAVAVNLGAQTAIGFTESINRSKANIWTTQLCKQLSFGCSASEACDYLVRHDFAVDGLSSFVIYGDSELGIS